MSNRMESNGKPDYEKMALIGKMNEMIGENLKLRAMVIELQEKVAMAEKAEKTNEAVPENSR